MKQLKLSKDCSHEVLTSFGFRKHGLNYKLNIPLYTYKKIPVISVHFLVSGLDNYIGYDVIDDNSGTIYSAYYDASLKNDNKVLDKIKKKLEEIFEEMTEKNILKGGE